jgi:hypothetical protein
MGGGAPVGVRAPAVAAAALLLACGGGGGAPAPSVATAAAPPATSAALHLDHVPIAVRSLDPAVLAYERLGFRIKPGRPHANGILNAFPKFADGSYLELITAPAAVDGLTARLVEFLEIGEGGRLLALRADSVAALAPIFDAAGVETALARFGRAFNILSFGDGALGGIFLIDYPVPVRDSAWLLDHPNTATGIAAAWLSDSLFDALAALPALFVVSGSAPGDVVRLAGGGELRRAREFPAAPGGTAAPAAHVRVAGVTLRVRDLAAARSAIRGGTGAELPITQRPAGLRLVVPPALAAGIWLELVDR